MKAIDLYSGIGGWALGLRIAGIDVVASYELWKNAADTEERNLRTPVHLVDIRKLEFSLLPPDVDIVVGSPPCTEFSFSNRGGSGDIANGLKDVRKFFEIVDAVRPTFWAMENVPRVAKILESELTGDGALSRFAHLRDSMHVEVIDMSRFGLPQRRKRCLAGNFDFDLLDRYAEMCPEITLGDAISELKKKVARDVNFGCGVPRNSITEHVKEAFLDEEETRINKEAKERHPVYNGMRFPDSMDKPVRTITATCTRVSRESVIVEDMTNPDHYRRLTVRERALLQGFPLTYQFFGNSYSEKLKMIGNAIPPVFTYYVAQAALGVSPEKVRPLPAVGYDHPIPDSSAPSTPPDQVGRSYPRNRRFRFAIPNLRFKSGTRFDLLNTFEDDRTSWNVAFYFGPSKDIRSIPLGPELFEGIKRLNWFGDFREVFAGIVHRLEDKVGKLDLGTLQARWPDKGSDGDHPFDLLDRLGDAAQEMIDAFPDDRVGDAGDFLVTLASDCHPKDKPISEGKLRKLAAPIVCGLVIGSWFNSYVEGNELAPTCAAQLP
ncbi:MAG: DNA (cytosine-5-)-methyltransferase [Proteobacteria bacterium]|nr:DNA (cytosine-5-)-methyltransferase [Pseudomonadota bacterium]